ncbi:hypothetical protein KJ766_03495 [Patescibacteria group bacterium]|nr:hypothetical protein [Patescibacteria group bacterium]
MKMNALMAMLAAIVGAAIVGAAIWENSNKTDYSDFAKCISEAGGQMYGSYWCSNCLTQKEDFGEAFEYINYNECSSEGSKTFDLCEGITGVPIWSRPDGQALMGRQPFESLADFYSCELPNNYE